MRTGVPERLLKIADDIATTGQASLTRLTVLKKWFERSGRLTPFAVWVAQRATSRKGKTTGEAAKLFQEARKLLKGLDRIRPELDRPSAQRLHDLLHDFQNEFRDQHWGPVRIIHNWNLMLIEEALAIYLRPMSSPVNGYKLAADYCQNYDPRYGNGLNGSSKSKIEEIVRFMFTMEALEDETG